MQRSHFERRSVLTAGLAAMASALIPGAGLAASSFEIARTSTGRLRGARQDGILAFKSIPYGKAGQDLRFKRARRPEPWSGVRDALAYTTKCPDAGGTDGDFPNGIRIDLPERLVDSEDCLHLHLWTPALRDGGRRPVMVWLHGGGFASGSGSTAVTDGTRLAKRGDVVVISVTHRLNAFGFLYISEFPGGDEYPDAGNIGMLDIIQALEWVRDHVEEFGGDPDNVTIFGFSGGGGKVATLMAMPAAKALIHRCIDMSGSTGIGGRSAKYAALDADMLMHLLGMTSSQTHDLAALPMARLRDGVLALKNHRVGNFLPWSTDRDWRPVVDGRNLPAAPWYPDAPGISRDVPLLIGSCHDEVRMHLLANDPDGLDVPLAEREPRIESWLRTDTGGIYAGPAELNVGEILSWYRDRFPGLTNAELEFKIITFWRWRYAMIWQAEHRIKTQSRPMTWMYRFDWATPVAGGSWGAFHGIDRPLAFDNVPIARSVYGDGVDAQRMADQVSDVWIAFARHGHPACPAVPQWPAYDLESRATMVFNLVSAVQDDPEADERKLFSGFSPSLSK